jgi:hypothetical protein
MRSVSSSIPFPAEAAQASLDTPAGQTGSGGGFGRQAHSAITSPGMEESPHMGSPDFPPNLNDAADAQAAPSALNWDLCAGRLAGDYRVCVDRGGRNGRLRYVAVASSLATRPYAVVTSDPDELLQALGCTDSAAASLPARGNLL